MREQTFGFARPHGVTLHVYHWEPEGAPRGAILIAHGMSEHAGRYRHVAQALCDAGFVVYADDHRGHGQSAAGAEDLGFAGEDGWTRCVEDIEALAAEVRQRHPALPLALVAHSMGSLMSQQVMINGVAPLDAVALSGSNGKVGALLTGGLLAARVERRRLGRRGRSPLLNQLSFGAFNKAFKPARTEFDWLSRDPAQVDLYLQDPLCGFMVTTQFWVDMLRGLRVIEDPSQQARVRKDLPVYIFAGALDPVSNATKGLQQLLGAYRAAGLTQVQHKFYPEARHEVFNETNRQEVIADLLQWLEQALFKQ